MIVDKELSFIKSCVKEYLPFEISDYGKMIRSKLGLCILHCMDIGITDNHYKFLTAIELIHNASLLHDDVIDEDIERRNQPNIRTIYNNKTSILYGDVAISNVLEILTDIGEIEIIKGFNRTLKRMCEGELAQYNNLNKIPDIDEYINKSDLKTGSLFTFLAEGINILTSCKISDSIADFCHNFGISFQIKNDLDNILTDKSDIKNGIYTAPVIYSNGIDITKEAIEKTKYLIDNYRSKCINSLSEIKESPYKEELIGVVECLTK